jgi:hypothetical protein
MLLHRPEVSITNGQAMNTNQKRRKLWKAAGAALALIPIVVITRPARASTNAALRTQLRYQDTSKDGMKCVTCLEFVAGKSGGLGSCKVIPGDDEISPDGYCISWNTM